MHPEPALDIHRVRRDLETMREALGAEQPIGGVDVAGWIGVAVVSGAGALAVWTGSAAVSEVTDALWVALVIMVMGAVVRAWSGRAAHPARWREIRAVARVKLVVLPAVVAFGVWQMRAGAAAPQVVSSTAFLGAVVAFLYATSRPWRRSGFGLAIPLLALALVVPMVPAGQILHAMAWTGVVAGVACASLLALQRRSRST